MAGKIKISFRARVLILVLSICWILVGTVMIFQYHREKEFKALLFDTRLQMHNDRILDDMRRGESINDIVGRIDKPVKDLRITIIDRNGNVIYDNNGKTPFPAANHNSRPEVADARKYGSGHSVARISQSDDVNYFYSALLGDNGIVIRSAAPYTHTLADFLKADSTLLWIMLCITIVMSIVAFLITRKISLTISRLNQFAQRAERGERIYNEEAFPDDELGCIAGNIVKLYIQRDRRHRDALKQEQDKIRLKKQLTNNINHELKTPVASILVCADLLEDHPEIDEGKKKECLDRIRSNASRLNSLLMDVSEITRMDEGERMIEKENLDLSDLIKDIVAEKRLQTDMKIVLNIPDNLHIHGNRRLLSSIFCNLIDNAISYSGATEITVTGDINGNFIVADNGVGIDSKHLEHIFERFYRIDKGRSREAGGTGLGLSIVKNAVAIHGGSISAHSIKGLSLNFNLKIC